MNKNKLEKMKMVSCVLILLVTLLPVAAYAEKVTVSFATKGPGATDYVIYSAYASVINKYSKSVSATLGPASGSTVSIKLMAEGKMDFGNVASWDAYEAYLGKGGPKNLWEKEGPQRFREVFNSYKAQVTFWTRPDTGIKSAKDFKGKKVMNRRPQVPFWNLLAHEIPRYYGLEPKRDYVEQPIASTSKCAQALIEGRTDVYWSLIGGSHAYDVKRAVGILALSFPNEVMDHLVNKGYPVYYSKPSSSILKDLGMPQDYKALTYSVIWVCRENLDKEIVYEITKILFENYKERAAIHPKAGEATMEFAVFQPTVPFHEGSIRYFKEKGVWSADHEQLQQKLLNLRR
jgi:TRAP transporter TAXI family solute receptor